MGLPYAGEDAQGDATSLRTTFIVGYPGETDEEYNSLLDFIQEIRFDRVGAFQFSFEPGTTSEPLGTRCRHP